MRALCGVGLSMVASGCVGSCGGDPILAERRTDQWAATVHCESVRNVIGVGANRQNIAAFSARVLFTVTGVGDRRVRTMLPGWMANDDDQPKLDATCRRQRATIEVRESAEGTVFAAQIEGARQSAVILRAPNGALINTLAMHEGTASAVAQRHPSPMATVVAMLSDGTLRDVVNPPALDALDDRALRAHREVFLSAAERCDASTALVDRLVRQAPDETADRLFDSAYIRGRCSRTRLALESPQRDLAAPRVARWIAEHGASTHPWPAGIMRYADEHAIATPAADAAVPDAHAGD